MIPELSTTLSITLPLLLIAVSLKWLPTTTDDCKSEASARHLPKSEPERKRQLFPGIWLAFAFVSAFPIALLEHQLFQVRHDKELLFSHRLTDDLIY